jgi:hypothetical protein
MMLFLPDGRELVEGKFGLEEDISGFITCKENISGPSLFITLEVSTGEEAVLRPASSEYACELGLVGRGQRRRAGDVR